MVMTELVLMINKESVWLVKRPDVLGDALVGIVDIGVSIQMKIGMTGRYRWRKRCVSHSRQRKTEQQLEIPSEGTGGRATPEHPHVHEGKNEKSGRLSLGEGSHEIAPNVADDDVQATDREQRSGQAARGPRPGSDGPT